METRRRDNTFEEFCCKRVEKWDKRWGCEVKGVCLFVCFFMGEMIFVCQRESSRKERKINEAGKRKLLLGTSGLPGAGRESPGGDSGGSRAQR